MGGLQVRVGGRLRGCLQVNREGRIAFRPQDLAEESVGWSHPRGGHGASPGRLPPYFANLLPQGPNLVLAISLTGAKSELELMRALSDDLPGDLAMRPEEGGGSPSPGWASLAGMQPKLSMSRTERGYTLPARGVDGDWIVKLPGRIPRVPEVEYATFCWARAAGLQVPEVELVEVGRIQPVPLRYGPGAFAFAIRRYDRPPGGRIHQEDFAQVLNLPPERVVGSLLKGSDRSHGTQLRIIAALCPEDIEQWLRWLIFLILSGNNDAHHKNLALWYPDPCRARLAPFYDLVAQVVWMDHWVGEGEAFGLELHVDRARAFAELDMTRLLALCRKSGVQIEEARLWSWVEQAREAWTQLGAGLPLEADERRAIGQHLDGLPLIRGLLRKRA